VNTSKKSFRTGFVAFAFVGMLSCADLADAQFFTAGKGDLLAGFRKTSSGTFELVVNIGNVTNFIALAPGTTIPISNFTPTQFSAAFSNPNNLQWSVGGAFSGLTAFAGFPSATAWTTSARANTNVQSAPPQRQSSSAQQQARNRIVGVGTGANFISSGFGSTSTNNNAVLVREPSGDANALTVFIGDPSDSTIGDYQGTWYNVENVTPASFTSAQRSDLYQLCPDGTIDPITSQTTGSAYYVGYFTFNSDGTMTFTRASTSTTPPAPVLTIARTGNASTISFATTSGATYTLCFTNAAGLFSPVSTWPTSTTNIIGDGLVHTFTDTTTATNRFYSVRAQ
jgi:hypothetical protein